MPTTWQEVWDILYAFLTTTGVRLLVALLIVFVGFFVTKKFTKGLRNGKFFKHLDISVRGFLASFLNIVLKILIVLTAVAYMGVPMTSVVAAIGSCGLAIGLALQGSLANLAGGVLILAFKPFKVGDSIEAQGVSGTVREITVLYTHLTTADNRHVVIPNGELSNAKVINFSVEDRRRMDIVVGASYKSNPDTVRGVLLELAKKDARVLADPAPVVNVNSYGDSAINYTLRVWTMSVDYWGVNADLTNAIKAEFDNAGVEMPYPQLDVHIDK